MVTYLVEIVARVLWPDNYAAGVRHVVVHTDETLRTTTVIGVHIFVLVGGCDEQQICVVHEFDRCVGQM